jgi:4-amino-4-deoxy-L-arabinose transferase-like glycosyltransferase
MLPRIYYASTVSLALRQNEILLNQTSYRSYYFWLLFILLVFLLLFRSGAAPIYILDEAKNAECAREMMQRDDWIVPTFNGELRTDKPPLHYFFMIISYKIFGVSEFGARFFSAIMGLLTVLITYFYTKKMLNEFTAFCTVTVLVCSSHFLFEFRLAVPDPYLIFLITLGLFSAFTWLYENNTLQLYIAAIALGLATLAKGPIALVLPGLCILIWIVFTKKWKTIFTWHLIPAFVLLCIIILPWYFAVDRATNGEWTKGFFIENNLNRFSSPQEGHGGFFLLPLVFVLMGLLPFASFIGETIKQRKKVFQKRPVKFSLIVVLSFLAFFSISSTKLPNYAMPCYPFASVILGSFIALLLNNEISSKKYPYLIVLLFTLIIPVIGYFAIAKETEAREINWLSLFLLITPLILIIGTFAKSNWEKRLLVMFVAYCIFNIIGLQIFYPALYSKNPVAKTIDIVKQYPNVYAYNIFNPGYRFYLDKNIPRTRDVNTLKHWLDSTHNAIIITRTNYLDSLRALPLQELARHHDIFELPTTVILKNNAGL